MHASRVKFILEFGKGAELRGTDGCKVRRVAEQDGPFAVEELVEVLYGTSVKICLAPLVGGKVLTMSPWVVFAWKLGAKRCQLGNKEVHGDLNTNGSQPQAWLLCWKRISATDQWCHWALYTEYGTCRAAESSRSCAGEKRSHCDGLKGQ